MCVIAPEYVENKRLSVCFRAGVSLNIHSFIIVHDVTLSCHFIVAVQKMI